MSRTQLLKKTLLALTISLAGATIAMAGGADKASYNHAMKEAVAAADKAKSVGGEWRDVRWKKSKTALIPAAEKAAKKGDYAKAVSLLKMAKAHGELGYAQAIEQKNAGPRF